jgi:hypothetical protein
MKNIHYLIDNQNNQNLLWKQSSGPISKLKEFIIKNKEESIDEEDFFHRNDEKVLLISAEPGMGKSLILSHFAQNSSAENFFIKIILNTCTKTLDDLRNEIIKTQNSTDLLDFVFKSLLNKNDEHEIEHLKHLAKEGKLILTV